MMDWSSSPPRTRRRSVWARTFGNRGWRTGWFAAAVVLFIAGLWSGLVLFRPLSVPTRDLVVGTPQPPRVVVELTDARALLRAVSDPQPTHGARLLDFVRQELGFASLPILAAGGERSPANRLLSACVGTDTTVALFPSSGASGSHFVAVSRLGALQRVETAVLSLVGGWSKAMRPQTHRYQGTRITALTAASPPLYYAFYGRVVFISDSRSVIERTLDGISGGTGGFLKQGEEQAASLRKTRYSGMSTDRQASFYIRPAVAAPGSGDREWYGEVSVANGQVVCDIWAHTSPIVPATAALLDARTMALQSPSDARLVAWHTAAPRSWIEANLRSLLGVEWSVRGAKPEGTDVRDSMPVAFSVGGDSADLLPDMAVIYRVDDGSRYRRQLRTGAVRITVDGTPVAVRAGGSNAGDADTAEVRLGPDQRYFAGVGSKDDYAIVTTNPRYAERLGGPAARTFAETVVDGPATADLFYLRAAPSSLATDAAKISQLLALGASQSDDPTRQRAAAAVAKYVPLLSSVSRLEVDAMATPDGYRVLARADLADAPAPTQ
ncbi:hypothetical protein FJZ36_13040 [Candidatus Poribacteria bacterium]|nr:hypothetical protein [Candidatus Poribacteria bacterium]